MSRLRVVGALGLVLGAILVALGSGVPVTYGYIVFSPTENLESIEPSQELDLKVFGCAVALGGLEVRGRVDPPGPAPLQILVTSGSSTAAGVSRGASGVAQPSRSVLGTPGEFVVVIPWASEDSRFVVVRDSGRSAQAAKRALMRFSSIESCPNIRDLHEPS